MAALTSAHLLFQLHNLTLQARTRLRESGLTDEQQLHGEVKQGYVFLSSEILEGFFFNIKSQLSFYIKVHSTIFSSFTFHDAMAAYSKPCFIRLL